MGRTWWVALVGSLLLGLLIAAPVLADVKTEKDWPAQAEGHAAPKQKDIFGRSLDLAIWTWVVFFGLLYVLGKYAWGPLLEGLRKREQGILTAIAESQKAREEAQQLRKQLQAEMDRAHDTVRELLEEARRDAQYTSDEMLAKARSEIQAERERLRREIDLARDQSIQEIWKQAAELATLISSKAVRKQLSLEDHHHLVDLALQEMKTAATNRRHFAQGNSA